MTCIRLGCRRHGVTVRSAPQYPTEWRGPLCAKHRDRLDAIMIDLRRGVRAAVRACPCCKRSYSMCPYHRAACLRVGAIVEVVA